MFSDCRQFRKVILFPLTNSFTVLHLFGTEHAVRENLGFFLVEYSSTNV